MQLSSMHSSVQSTIIDTKKWSFAVARATYELMLVGLSVIEIERTGGMGCRLVGGYLKSEFGLILP